MTSDALRCLMFQKLIVGLHCRRDLRLHGCQIIKLVDHGNIQIGHAGFAMTAVSTFSSIRMERCIGNPIYQWSMMELERYFEFSEPLQTANAEHAWEHCNRVIREKHLTSRTIMKMSGVQLICTTDNPEDDLR